MDGVVLPQVRPPPVGPSAEHALERPIVLVRREMRRHVTLLREPQTASLADMRLLPRVDEVVSLDFVLGEERLEANAALERPLFRMLRLVPLEDDSRVERLEARPAFVALICRVAAFVSPQEPLVHEGFVTSVARVGVVVGVGETVSRQGRQRAVRFLAHFAVVRFFCCVRQHVGFELVFVTEFSFTHLTLVDSLRVVLLVGGTFVEILQADIARVSFLVRRGMLRQACLRPELLLAHLALEDFLGVLSNFVFMKL